MPSSARLKDLPSGGEVLPIAVSTMSPPPHYVAEAEAGMTKKLNTMKYFQAHKSKAGSKNSHPSRCGMPNTGGDVPRSRISLPSLMFRLKVRYLTPM